MLSKLCVALIFARASAFAPRSPWTTMRTVAYGAPPEMMEAAKKQVEAFKVSHAGHNPPELQALDNAISSDAEQGEIGAKMYELLCTSFLDYDRDEADETKLVPSKTAGQVLAKDLPGLSDVMTNLYTYGMRMIPSGFISIDSCKAIVEERLAKRVGMTGEEFDEWLDVPDAFGG